MFGQRTEQDGIRQVEFGTLDDGFRAVREPWLEQHDLPGSPAWTANDSQWRERCPEADAAAARKTWASPGRLSTCREGSFAFGGLEIV